MIVVSLKAFDQMSSERVRQKARLLKVAFGWSNMLLCIQRSSFSLSPNYVFNNVLRALRVKLLFEHSLCHSAKWILYLGNESDFYLSGNNVAEANILELTCEISTYWLWPLEPFSVPFGAPAQSDYFQSLGFCPNISLAGSGLPLQVSPRASGEAQATCFFTAAQVNAKHVPLVHIVCCKSSHLWDLCWEMHAPSLSSVVSYHHIFWKHNSGKETRISMLCAAAGQRGPRKIVSLLGERNVCSQNVLFWTAI